MKTIVIDLDGTLCDSAHRDHHARNGDWDQFHALLTEDKPHPDVLHLMDLLFNAPDEVELIGCTGRNERYRIATERWLLEHGALLDCVLMRPDHDFRPDHELKIEMIEAWHEQTSGDDPWPVQDRVAFILEDREKVVEAWRNAGFNCWQVRPGNF